MTNAEDIRADLLALLQRIAPEADLPSIRGEVPLREQIDLDSMDSLNLLAGVGERFGIEVPEDDYGRMQTLDDMVAYVIERTGARDG